MDINDQQRRQAEKLVGMVTDPTDPHWRGTVDAVQAAIRHAAGPVQPSMQGFTDGIAFKAIVETFDELLNSIVKVDRVGYGKYRCSACEATWWPGDSEGCSPGCVRVRAERAMAFLTKGNGGG